MRPPPTMLRRHAPRHQFDLLVRLRRLDECDVGTDVDGRIRTVDGLVQAQHGARIGTGDDQELVGAARLDGSADLRDELVARDHFLAFEVTASLGRHLVLDVDRRDASRLVLAHGARDVQFIAVARVGIGDHRDIDRPRHHTGVVGHLRLRQQAEVRKAAGHRRACPSHVDRGKPGLGNQPGSDAVIGAGRHDHARLRDQVSQRPSMLEKRICHDVIIF